MTDEIYSHFRLDWCFTSINRLRRDIQGYKTDYVLIVEFKTAVSGNIEDKKIAIGNLVLENVVSKISNVNLASLMAITDISGVLTWVINRLKLIFPKFDCFLQKVTLIESNHSEASFVFNEINSRSIITIEESGIAVNGKLYVVADLTRKEKVRLFQRCLEALFLTSNIGQQNVYTSKLDIRQISEELLHTSKPLYLSTFVCPPYIFTPGTGYTGIFTSVYDDPKSHNFDYDYQKVFEVCSIFQKLVDKISLPIKLAVVYCDWALINIDGIKSTLGSDDAVKTNLEMFYKSLVELNLKRYEHVSLFRLTDFNVQSYLPLGISQDAEKRREFIENVYSLEDHPIFSVAPVSFIRDILAWCTDEHLVRYLDWKNFNELNIWHDSKEDVVQLLKTYNNILWMRMRRIKDNPKKDELLEPQNKDIRSAAFYDALLRFLEYKVYGKIVSEALVPSACLYIDPGFTMAGNHFRNSMFPVLFVDSDSVLKII